MKARIVGHRARRELVCRSGAGRTTLPRSATSIRLSGGGASIGEVGLKTFQYLADELNAAGGLNGKKVEIVPLDNKTNPQESLIQAQKAADAGIRIITQGNGSSVAAALTDWVTKYNDRNPGKEIIYLNYAAVDPLP